MSNFIETLKETFENAKLFDNDNGDAIIPINFNVKNDSKIILVAGMNASGKSVISKMVEMLASDAKVEKRSCSMRNRTSGMFGQRMIFGDESDSSTGQNSVNSVILGFKSTVESKGAVLILDEPDIGLSDEYSSALGEYIAKQVNEHNGNIGLVFVVSHSKCLFNNILETLDVPCSTVYVGNANVSFDEWLNSQTKKATIEDLLNLKAKSRETWKRIESFISKKD